jgi:hypothetical protein
MTDGLTPKIDEFASALDPAEFAEREEALARCEEAAAERGEVRQLARQLIQEARTAAHHLEHRAESAAPITPSDADSERPLEQSI